MKRRSMENIYIIVAMTREKRAIGNKNNLLCHIPEDLKYFKDITKGNTIVVGYNTYMSFPKRPLPSRKNIVLTRKNVEMEGALIMNSVEEVLSYASKNPDEKIFICGGASVYEQFKEYADTFYISYIEKEFEADTFFPDIDEGSLTLVYNRKGEDCETVGIDYSFCCYKR